MGWLTAVWAREFGAWGIGIWGWIFRDWGQGVGFRGGSGCVIWGLEEGCDAHPPSTRIQAQTSKKKPAEHIQNTTPCVSVLRPASRVMIDETPPCLERWKRVLRAGSPRTFVGISNVKGRSSCFVAACPPSPCSSSFFPFFVFFAEVFPTASSSGVSENDTWFGILQAEYRGFGFEGQVLES